MNWCGGRKSTSTKAIDQKNICKRNMTRDLRKLGIDDKMESYNIPPTESGKRARKCCR